MSQTGKKEFKAKWVYGKCGRAVPTAVLVYY